MPKSIVEVTEWESSLKLRLTIRYHKFLGVSESAYTFTVYVLLGVTKFFRYTQQIFCGLNFLYAVSICIFRPCSFPVVIFFIRTSHSLSQIGFW